MQKGIVFSAILHITTILFVVIGLPHVEDKTLPEPDVIPVEIVNIDKETTVKEPEPEKKPEPEQKPEPTAVAAAPAPPPTPADAVPPPPDVEAKPEKKPEKKPEPKKAEKPVPQTPRVTPARRPKPPSRFNVDRLAALLDKKLKEDAPEESHDKEPEKDQKKVTTPSRSAIDKARLTASLQAAIRKQVERCWNVPAGARDAGDLKVKVRIYLLPDGSLAKPPEIVDRMRMNAPGQSFFRVAAESARRAVQKCAPLKLPVDMYDIWRDTELTFDPKEMLDG